MKRVLAGEPPEMEFRVDISPRLKMEYQVTPSLVWAAYLRTLAEHGRDLADAVENDDPVDLNFRVSNQDVGKVVDSPEQQLEECVEWCANWKKRPAALLVEYLGGSPFTKRRRRMWHAWQEELLDGLIIDPLTGSSIRETVVWDYNRFSRHPDEAGPYIRARQLRSGFNLYRALELDDGPRKLTPERASDIRTNIVAAERYVIDQRRTIMRANKKKAERGYPVGKSKGFWHRQEGKGSKREMKLKPEVDAIGIDIYLSIVAGDTLGQIGARYGKQENWVGHFVRSPSNAGLIRLRIDEERALEADYKGELFPKFLLVDKHDEECVFTPEAVRSERRLDTPIQQGVPYWLWRRANDNLSSRPAPSRGVRRASRVHLGSGVLRCPCGKPHLHASTNYQCNKSDLLPTGLKRGGWPARGVARDGRRHSSIRDNHADLALRELAFACHRLAEQKQAAELEHARNSTAAHSESQLSASREAAEADLVALEARRKRVKTLFTAGLMDETEMEVEAAEIKQLEADARVQLAGVSREAHRRRHALVKPGQSVEEAWAEAERDGNTEWQRRLIETYIDHVIVRTNTRRLGDRLHVVFVDGLDVPRDQVCALLNELWREVDNNRRRQAFTSRDVIERAVELYDERTPLSDIAQKLNAEGHRTLRTKNEYGAASVHKLLSRELAERGRAYIPPKRKGTVTQSVIDTIDSLRKEGKTTTQIADILNRAGRTTGRGNTWDARAVRSYVRQWLHSSRPESSNLPHLPSHVEQQLGRLRGEGKSLRELCDWLTAEGWSTRSGRPWHSQTIHAILRRLEHDRMREGEPEHDRARADLVDTIDSLLKERKNLAEIADILNRIGRTTPQGNAWNRRSLGLFIRRWCKASRSEGNHQLPCNVERQLEQFRNEGKTMQELCQWLTAEGWSTRSGRPWSASTITGIFRRLEYDRLRVAEIGG